jgi:hypothetical protein
MLVINIILAKHRKIASGAMVSETDGANKTGASKKFAWA